MYASITVFGTWMLLTQVRKVGCDPSGAADPRNKCDYFDLPWEVTGSGILISLLCVAFGGQSMGQVATVVEVYGSAAKSVKSGFDVICRKQGCGGHWRAPNPTWVHPGLVCKI